MQEYAELFVKVPVNSPEEAERLAEANYTGMLSDMIVMWLRYGSAFSGPLPVRSQPMQVAQVQQVVPVQHTPKRQDPEVHLQQVETEVGQLTPTVEVETVPPSRPKGLAGRGRMRRS